VPAGAPAAAVTPTLRKKKPGFGPNERGMSKWPFTTLHWHLPVTVTATRPDLKATAHLDRATSESPLAAPPTVGSGPSDRGGEVPPARRAGLIMMPLRQCTCHGCARSLVRFAPIRRPHLRFGTALIAYHRTGLIPAHLLCTRTKSTPHPHDWATSAPGLRRSLAHLRESAPESESALRKNPSPAHICTAAESVPRRRHLRHHCCPPGHLPLRNTIVTP
jgi:hypothetical protein